MAEGEMREIFWTNLNWDDLDDMTESKFINCVRYFMLLTKKYGPLDITDEVQDIISGEIVALDMIRLKSGIRKKLREAESV